MKIYIRRTLRVLCFLLFIAPTGARATITISPNFADTVICIGDTVLLPFTTSYSTLVTYNAQLSNPSGSFLAGTTTIGSVLSTSAATIICIVPKGVPNGITYRLRVKSVSPLDSSSPVIYNIRIGTYPDSVKASYTGTLCEGDSIRFHAISIPGVVYSWQGPAGFVAGSQNPLISKFTSQNNGDYYVTSSINGCALHDSITLVSKPIPTLVSATSNSPRCTGDTLLLIGSASVVTGLSFAWKGPGITGVQPVVAIDSVTLNHSGEYILTATLNGCSVSDTTAVVVNQQPLVPVVTNTNPACIGRSLRLFANSNTQGVKYLWTGPNGFISTNADTIINNIQQQASGTYIARAIISNCSAQNSVFISVDSTPAKPVVLSNDPCEGDTLRLTASPSTNGTYHWDAAGFIFPSFSSIATRGNIGLTDTFGYSVYVLTSKGCSSDTNLFSIIVKSKPQLPTVSTNSPVCEGHNLDVKSQGVGGLSYVWRNAANTIIATDSSFSIKNISRNATGNLKLTVSLSNGCSRDSLVPIVVNPAATPDITISANPDVIIEEGATITFTASVNNGGNNPILQWQKNGVDIPGATNKTYQCITGKDVVDNDKVSVKMRSNELCVYPDTILSYNFIVHINTEINNPDSALNFSVYPNPTWGSFVIKGNVNTDETVGIVILDATGKNVYQVEVKPAGKKIDIPVSIGSLSSSNYFIHIKAANRMKTLPLKIRR